MCGNFDRFCSLLKFIAYPLKFRINVKNCLGQNAIFYFISLDKFLIQSDTVELF